MQFVFAVLEALACEREDELFAGARDRHIAQTAFLLDPARRLLHGAFVGEEPLLHADHEDDGEFQALRGVDGGEDRRVAVVPVVVLRAVGIVHEGEFFEQVAEREGIASGRLVVFELGDGIDEFQHVFLTVFRLVRVAVDLQEPIQIADVVEVVRDFFREAAGRGEGVARLADCRNQVRRRVRGGLRDGFGERGFGKEFLHRRGDRLPQIAQTHDRLVADAARRHADHAQQALVVAPVQHEFQVRHGVLDLLALEEFLAADDPGADIVRVEGLFERAREVVRAVQHREIPVAVVRIGGDDVFHHVVDEFRLGVAVLQLSELDLLAVAFGRPQAFVEPRAVVGDDAVRGAEDVVGGTVVLFELDLARAGEIGREVQDVSDVGAAPRVDALIIVADHADVLPELREILEQFELGGVGVLILVDQQVAVTVLIARQTLRLLLEYLQDEQQKVVEIQRVLKLQDLLVAFVDRQIRVIAARGHVGGELHPVLAAADERRDFLRRDLVPAESELGGRLLDDADLVAFVEDAVVRVVVARERDVAPQDARAERVERAERDLVGRRAGDHRRHAFAHLRRGLVREGHARDLFRRDALLDHVRDTGRDDARFARARAGKHKERSLDLKDRFPLFRVQAGQTIAHDGHGRDSLRMIKRPAPRAGT